MSHGYIVIDNLDIVFICKIYFEKTVPIHHCPFSPRFTVHKFMSLTFSTDFEEMLKVTTFLLNF